jgi:hypothetical protein
VKPYFVNGSKPKLINGKVWVPDAKGGYRKLPEDDPRYREVFLWIDSQRFVELLDWVYKRKAAREKR